MNRLSLNNCLNCLEEVRHWTKYALHHGEKKEILSMAKYIEKINNSLTGALTALASFSNDQNN